MSNSYENLTKYRGKMNKETSVQTIETSAKDLHSKGLERWQIVLELAKVFSPAAIIKWINKK